jgi:predicted lipoprotein with Yx(FWY)xxD motif
VVPKTFILVLAASLAAIALGRAASAPAGTSAQAAGGARGAATLTVRSSRYGPILFGESGRALYAFTRDRRGGGSRCYGACAKAWPVYVANGRLAGGPGVRQSLLGTTRRRDGRRQVTYDGRPLYFYAGDGVGQVKCQNVDEYGGTWLVVRPNGRLVRQQ